MPTNKLRPAAPVETSDFATAVLSKTLQNQISKSVPDEKSRARFTSAIIQVVSGSEELQKCTPATIISSALRGEGMNLMMGSQYYIVPFGGSAAFVLGYKGMIQLAMSTKEYEAIDCTDVREGEYLGRDPETGQPLFQNVFGADDEARENTPIIGYKSFFRLRSGFKRTEYWSMEKIVNHAVKFSHIDRQKITNAINGNYTPGKKESPWYDYPDGFQKMAMKTVMRALLNSGYAPLNPEVKYAIDSDADLIIPDVPQPIPVANDPLIIDAPKAEQTVKTPSDENTATQTVRKRKADKTPTEGEKAVKNENTDDLSEHMNAPESEQIPAQQSMFDALKV